MQSSQQLLKVKESPAVQAHISMLQGIIDKMSKNCTHCKTWAVTIVSAIIMLVMEGKADGPKALWVAYIPIALFFLLDCFYLGQEHRFKKEQSRIVNDINSGNLDPADIFYIDNDKGTAGKWLRSGWEKAVLTFKSIFSFSTLPFYGILALVILIIRHV